eukprot:Nk52_evm144s226 gene=Nk52_evmTU144s226
MSFPIVVPRDEDILQMKLNLAMGRQEENRCPAAPSVPPSLCAQGQEEAAPLREVTINSNNDQQPQPPPGKGTVVTSSLLDVLSEVSAQSEPISTQTATVGDLDVDAFLTEEFKENSQSGGTGNGALSSTLPPASPTGSLDLEDLDLSQELDLTKNCERFFDDAQLKAIGDAFNSIDVDGKGRIPLYPGLEQLLIELGHPLPEHHIAFLIQEMDTQPAFVDEETPQDPLDSSTQQEQEKVSSISKGRYFTQRAVLSGLTKLALMSAPQLVGEDMSDIDEYVKEHSLEPHTMGTMMGTPPGLAAEILSEEEEYEEGESELDRSDSTLDSSEECGTSPAVLTPSKLYSSIVYKGCVGTLTEDANHSAPVSANHSVNLSGFGTGECAVPRSQNNSCVKALNSVKVNCNASFELETTNHKLYLHELNLENKNRESLPVSLLSPVKPRRDSKLSDSPILGHNKSYFQYQRNASTAYSNTNTPTSSGAGQASCVVSGPAKNVQLDGHPQLGMTSPRTKAQPAYQNLRQRHRELTEMYDAAVSCLHDAEDENRELLGKVQDGEKAEKNLKELKIKYESLQSEYDEVLLGKEASDKKIVELQNEVACLKMSLQETQKALDESIEDSRLAKMEVSELKLNCEKNNRPAEDVERLVKELQLLKGVLIASKQHEGEVAETVAKLQEENKRMKDSLDESEAKAVEAKKEATFFSRLAQSPRRVQSVSTTPSRALSEELRMVPASPYSPRKTAERDPRKLIRNLLIEVSEEEKIILSIREIVVAAIGLPKQKGKSSNSENISIGHPSKETLQSHVEFLEGIVGQFRARVDGAEEKASEMDKTVLSLARRSLQYILLVMSSSSNMWNGKDDSKNCSCAVQDTEDEIFEALCMVYRSQFSGRFKGQMQLLPSSLIPGGPCALEDAGKIEPIEECNVDEVESSAEPPKSPKVQSSFVSPALVCSGVVAGLLARYMVLLAFTFNILDVGDVLNGVHPT